MSEAHEDKDYAIDAETVSDIVIHLLQLVLAFVEPDEAKALVDRVALESANASADAAEALKFGKVN